MARTYNDIYYNDDENSTAEILDDMKKLAESVDQQIGSIKSFNNDTSQFIEQVTPLMNTLSEQVIDMHQLADTMFTELEQVKEENKQLREDLNGLPKGQASGESIDLNDSAEMRCELKISGNSVQDGEPTPDEPVEVESCGDNGSINEVICNKNILPFDEKTETWDGAQIIFGKNEITVKPNASNHMSIETPGNLLNTHIKKGTVITESASYKSGATTYQSGAIGIGVYLYYSDGTKETFRMGDIVNNTVKITKSNTITLEKDVIAMQYYTICYMISGLTSSITFDFQIEVGETATAFEQHKEQSYIIPIQQSFKSIGDIRDTFIKKNNKWYERHYIFRKIFDGTETFTKETRNKVTNFYMSLEGFGSQKGYCNILPVVNNDSYIANILFIWGNLNGFSMMFDTSRFGTLSDYKSYLKSLYDAGTPAYLDYVLKEPLDIECTLEQTEILNQMYIKAKTYKGVTHMYSTDNVSPVIDVTYKKDIETLFANTLVEGV